MKAMFHPVDEYKLPQDEEAFSYDNDFDKFNDIQQFNFAEIRGESIVVGSGTEAASDKFPEVLSDDDVITSQKQRPIGKPPKSLRSNLKSSFKSIKSSPGDKKISGKKGKNNHGVSNTSGSGGYVRR